MPVSVSKRKVEPKQVSIVVVDEMQRNATKLHALATLISFAEAQGGMVECDGIAMIVDDLADDLMELVS